MTKQEEKTGEAYAFFKCRATKEDIEQELPKIRSTVGVPSELELSLTSDILNVSDKDLADNARKFYDAGAKYALKGRLPNASNRETASELAEVLRQAYISPLYNPEDKFIAGIYYKEGNDYKLFDPEGYVDGNAQGAI
jgi:hypothetical protein